jgi:hypothetical protein
MNNSSSSSTYMINSSSSCANKNNSSNSSTYMNNSSSSCTNKSNNSSFTRVVINSITKGSSNSFVNDKNSSTDAKTSNSNSSAQSCNASTGTGSLYLLAWKLGYTTDDWQRLAHIEAKLKYVTSSTNDVLLQRAVLGRDAVESDLVYLEGLLQKALSNQRLTNQVNSYQFIHFVYIDLCWKAL